MQTKNLYEPFQIEYVEASECPVVAHKHTFFELVYILDGTGVQSINENKLAYGADKLFLLMPQHFHAFQVETPTKFLFIRFTDAYLKKQTKEKLQKLEFIFNNHHHQPGCIVKNKSDKVLVKSLVEALLREQVNRQVYHQELTEQILTTLLTIVARNISDSFVTGNNAASTSDVSIQIVNYIHEHIRSPRLLKAGKIASRFHIAPTYISEYFRKITGESLQHYIITQKIKLIETRLRYSDMRINEIAFEFGFSDESHLVKTFKKYTGTSPARFREKETSATLG